jgi:5'-methylthioadenosine phosphorylase/5'-methylthioinosine phosphorylase
MARFVIIGGTGTNLLPVELDTAPAPQTEWGQPSASLTPWPADGRHGDDRHEVRFLPRHGVAGNIAPHAVNYRANIDLISAFQPDFVIALNAVGGIDPALEPGALAIPDQLVDYTWGRAHTFYDQPDKGLQFIEFTMPYSNNLRLKLIEAAATAGVQCAESATYGVTQGPRLETAAEIDRLERDGCALVGMTAMPEAALARERQLEYAGIALIVNRAAGRVPAGADPHQQALHAEMAQYLDRCIAQVGRLLAEFREQV